MWAAQGILAALYERERTGQGRLIECSLFETAIAFSSWTSAGYLADGKEPTRQGSRHRQNAPYQRFQTGDGYMMIGASSQSLWERMAAALDHPEWVDDPRFPNSQNRVKNRPALEAMMEDILKTNTTAHWVGVLDDAGVPCGPVNNYEQLFADPQLKARGMVVHAHDEKLGDIPHIRTPIKMGDSIAVRHVAPRLGEHNAEVFGSVGASAEDLAKLKAKGVI
jgi:crotonobetainyl-CoA:carnitine CoA-transferase CaiB-like acyl-CoA transferase